MSHKPTDRRQVLIEKSAEAEELKKKLFLVDFEALMHQCASATYKLNFDNGKYVLNLHNHELASWDTRSAFGNLIFHRNSSSPKGVMTKDASLESLKELSEFIATYDLQTNRSELLDQIDKAEVYVTCMQAAANHLFPETTNEEL